MIRRWRIHAGTLLLAAVFLGCLRPPALGAQEGPGSWISIGPNPSRGGRVSSIAVDPSNEAHWLIGAGQGGIWETFDSGATFTARTDDQPSLAMGAMAFAPSNPKIVYAGTGEPNYEMSFVGSGLLKSVDGGTTWELMTANTFFKGRAISGLAVDPMNPAVLVAATVPARAGRLLTQALIGETPGIFQSADGGVTWSRKFTGQATSLAVDPGNFSKQYAGVGTLFSPAITPASGNGIYRSFDGGSTWTVVSGPWSSNANSIGRVVLAIAPSDSSVLYVGMEDGIQRQRLLGLWRTDNAWATAPTWVRIENNSIDNGSGTYGYCAWNHDANSPDLRCGYANFLAVQPDRSNVLWAAGRDLWRYDGANWSLIATGQTPALSRNVCCFHGDLHGLVWAGARLIAATDGSVYSTIDEGNTWSAHNGMAITQFYDGALHPSNPSFILGAVQDLAQQIVWTGSNDWRHARTSTHDTDGAIIGSLRPEIDWGVSLSLFGGLPTILRTKDGGNSFKPGDGIDWNGLGSNRPKIARCPNNENVVLTGSNRLWKSTNFFNGDTPSFSANSVNMNTEVSAFAFAPSDQSCETYAFGTWTGQLRLTTNGGATWLDINPLRAIPARGVTEIAFDPANTNVLYVALSGFDEETPGSSGHLFKTTAATTQATISSSAWMNISTGNEPHNTIAIDPDYPDVVYAGTDHGVWRSLAAGSSWTRMGSRSGMPNVSVFKLAFSPGTRQLAAFTFGRGAFRLSDTAPPSSPGLQLIPSLLSAVVGSEFSQTLTATGGNPPYAWSVGTGFLPPGITLSAAGTISGTPTSPGVFALTTLVTDASGTMAAATYTVSIASTFSPFSVTNFGGTSATSVDQGSAAASGYARIQPATGSTAPSGVAIFGFRQNETVISEVGVPATPVLSSGRLYAEIGNRVNAGLAIANPNNSTATISFFFTDVSGNQAGSGRMTIPPNQQIAQFLDQMPFHVYSTPTFQGTFSFTSSVPIAVIALRGLTNERAEFLMSTLPVIDTTPPAATGPVVAAYFADGGGWSTQVLLVNPTDTAMTGTVQFFSPTGAPVSVTIGGAARNTFTYTIPARGSQKLVTSGAGSPISTGSLKVLPSSANGPVPTPLVIFSYKPADVTVSEAGVPVTTGGLLRLYVESSSAGNIESGIAIANLAPTANTVTLSVTDLTGVGVSGVAGATVLLPAGGQTAKFLHDLFPRLPNPFKGVVRIGATPGTGPSSLSVAGLRTRTNERGDFLITTTPPAEETGGTTTAPLFFPQVVIGGGYTTQFILFSGRSNQTPSGSLYFFKSDGTAWPLTLN